MPSRPVQKPRSSPAEDDPAKGLPPESTALRAAWSSSVLPEAVVPSSASFKRTVVLRTFTQINSLCWRALKRSQTCMTESPHQRRAYSHLRFNSLGFGRFFRICSKTFSEPDRHSIGWTAMMCWWRNSERNTLSDSYNLAASRLIYKVEALG